MKKRHVCEKDYTWNPCENEKYLASIMDDSEIMCDEFIELNDKETKTIPTNLNEKKVIRKTHNSYILLGFWFIIIALLIAFPIYCYVIKYQAIKNIYYHFMLQIIYQKKLCINNINQKWVIKSKM